MTKTLYCICLVLFFSAGAHAQMTTLPAATRDSIKSRYWENLKQINITYQVTGNKKTNRIMQPDAIDTALKPIFSTVILNNDDLINNGSAGSVTQGNDKTALSFNYAKFSNAMKAALNLGLYGTSSGSITQFYADNSWQKGIGLNTGLTILSVRNSLSFDPKKIPAWNDERTRGMRLEQARYNAILDLDISSALIEQKKLDSLLAVDNRLTYEDVKDTAYLDSIKKKYDEVTVHIKKYQSLVTHRNIDSIDYHGIANKFFVAFDNAHVKSSGYVVWWYMINVDMGIRTNKLYNDTLYTNDSVFHFVTKNYGRIKVNFSINRASNQFNHLLFISGSMGVWNTNFLENRNIANIPSIRYDAAKKAIIRTNEGETLGAFDDYKSNIWAVSPSLYFACFMGTAKVLGIEAAASYQFNLNVPSTVNMPGIVNATLGLLMRVSSKDDVSKSTIGLVAGIFNGQYDTQVWKNAFGMQLKIGVPFKAVLGK